MNDFDFYKPFLTQLIKQHRPGWHGGNSPFLCLVHKEKTPSASIDPRTGNYHCFGCGFSGDTIDLLQKLYSLKDKKEALEKARELFGGDISESSGFKKRDFEVFGEHKNTRARARMDSANSEKSVEFFKESHSELEAWFKHDNPTGFYRGISLKTYQSMPVGISEDNRQIYFFSDDKNHKQARDLFSHKYLFEKGQGKSFFFNECALDREKPVFVTEGAFDALSFLEIGYEAIGLNGATNYKKLIDLLKTKKWKGSLVLALDNDKTGKTTTFQMSDALSGIPGISFNRFDWSEAYREEGDEYKPIKDPNEFLEFDRKLFELTASDALFSFGDEYRAKNSSEALLYDFLDDKNKLEIYPTEYTDLNKVLTGGFPVGLTVLGASSSTGKSAFALQLATYYASQGNEVLFFSLEMSKNELIARALSTECYKLLKRRYLEDGDEESAIKAAFYSPSASEILLRSSFKSGVLTPWTNERFALLNEAKENFSEVAKNLFLIEGEFSITAESIKKAVYDFMRNTGKAPIVFVDYLQIISPAEGEKVFSERQIVDNAMKTFKVLSRNISKPFFVVSSVSRKAYEGGKENEPIKQSDFKESGGIEFTADILLGISKAEEKKEFGCNVLRFDILKNRHGLKDQTAFLDFYGKVGRFAESLKNIEE